MAWGAGLRRGPAEGCLRRRRAGDIIDSVAQLIVRNLEKEVVQALQRRAARHGRSAEAEHREILRAALLKQGDFKAFLETMPEVGEEFDECFEVERGPARDVDL